MEYNSSIELYHHGIKGQKWGVRRFQNKDGSLTNAGGKRYNGSDYKSRKSLGEKISDHRAASKRKKNLEKARKARVEKKKAEEEAKIAAEKRKKDVESGKIKARDMTNEELNDRINRLNNEKRYNQLLSETDPAGKATSVGKKFIEKMWNEAIQPAVAESGKQILKDSINNAVKKNTKVEEFDIDKFWKNRNKKTTQEIIDINRRLMAEDQIADKMKARKEEKDAEKVRKQAADYYNSEERRNESIYTDTTYSKKGSDIIDSTTQTRSISNPPAVVKSVITNLSNQPMNSKEFANNAYRGEKVCTEVLDRYGNLTKTKNRNGGNR